MARVFIHVGPHKTGTTYLQNVLVSNRDKLKEQGVCVPLSGALNKSLPHHNLAWDIAVSKSNYKPEHGGVEALCEEIKDEKHVVISSETFSSFPHCFFKIANALTQQGHDVFSIFVVRDQLSIINSAYTQRIKTLNLDMDFDTYFEGALTEKRYDQLEFYKDLWASKAANRFIVYSRDNLLADFLKAAEMPDAELDMLATSQTANVSPNNFEIEILRKCAPVLKTYGKDFMTTLNLLRQKFKDAEIDGAKSFWGPSIEQTREAREHFAECNRKFCLKYDIDSSVMQFRNKTKTAVIIDKLPKEKKAEVSGLLKDFLKEILS